MQLLNYGKSHRRFVWKKKASSEALKRPLRVLRPSELLISTFSLDACASGGNIEPRQDCLGVRSLDACASGGNKWTRTTDLTLIRRVL